MKKILLSGQMGSGKTTIQNALTLQIPASITMNFADVIYEMQNECLRILNRYIPPRGIVKDGPLLQVLGTEWGRKTLGENIWVDIMRKRLQIVDGIGVTHVIMGDCRFQNEFDGFPDAFRVRLKCDREQRKIRCSMWRENESHESETALDQYEAQNKFDLVLDTGKMSVHECVITILEHMEGFDYERGNGQGTSGKD